MLNLRIVYGACTSYFFCFVQTMYLPYEIKHLSGMVADLPKVYGKNSSKALEATQPRNRNQDQFNELS